MGWTSYHATHYKNGNVDRKAECDACFMEGLSRGHYKVKKSAMRGAVYYAAVENLKKYAGRDEEGNCIYADVPENERETWAAVFLTSTNSKDYFNFSYKDMAETVGPYKYDCPLSILNMLSPTENEYALKWRAACRERAQKQNSISKLPIGAIIEYDWYGETKRAEKRAPNYQFKTPWWKIVGDNKYVQKSRIPKSFTVVSVPEMANGNIEYVAERV